MLYYPELTSDRYVLSEDFPDDKTATESFLSRYKEDLIAVIRDDDPEIAAVWQSFKDC